MMFTKSQDLTIGNQTKTADSRWGKLQNYKDQTTQTLSAKDLQSSFLNLRISAILKKKSVHSLTNYFLGLI